MDHFFVQWELVDGGPAVPLFPEEFEAFSQMECVQRRVWPSGHVELRRVESLCLTVIQDMCTRCVLAVRVWDRPPTTRTSLLALRDAVERYGLPEVLYTDNGSDLKNGLILAVLNAVGIYHAHSEPYRPQGRGQVERVGRTIKEMILPHLPGFRGGTHPRSWADADLLTIEEVEALLADRIEAYYNGRIHRTTRRCPREHYESAIHARQLHGLTRVELTPEVWLPLLSIQDEAVLQNCGIELNGHHYSSPGFIEALNGRRVRIYFDEFRPDTIYVALPNPRGEFRFLAVAERTDDPSCPPPTAWAFRQDEQRWLEARQADNTERAQRQLELKRLQEARLKGEARGRALADAVFPAGHAPPAAVPPVALLPGSAASLRSEAAQPADDRAMVKGTESPIVGEVDSLEGYLRLAARKRPNRLGSETA
jgi:hypothetical protein